MKTGAADSAWLRSVYSYNDDSFDGLILVTADVGARNAAREISEGSAPRIASNLDELRHLLDEEQSVATLEQADKFRTAVQTKIDTPEDLHYLADLGPRNWWSPAALDRDFRSDWEQQETDIASVGAVEIVGSATYDPWSDAVTGRVRVPVTIEEQYARQDASGDSPEYLFVTYNASVEAGVTVYLNTTREADAVVDDEFAVVRLAVDDDSVDQFNF
ncbi:hypothetical protein SAMN05443575_0373 [Jatrophihabitans endophyticus]|uniref:Uncharacterized protein n=1 Tax=Jatrophihabitans endophyticus TaxID=1206085 RepID=A0A1M5CWP4_9ACTN|nr:hypothetical protein SAMN05443575_0373 [Jatrophihabitans endophyticus]